jgi:hypothetical protein
VGFSSKVDGTFITGVSQADTPVCGHTVFNGARYEVCVNPDDGQATLG